MKSEATTAWISADRRPPRELRSRPSLAKWTSTPRSMISPRSAQSLRLRAERSILWISTPRALPDFKQPNHLAEHRPAGAGGGLAFFKPLRQFHAVALRVLVDGIALLLQGNA